MVSVIVIIYNLFINNVSGSSITKRRLNMVDFLHFLSGRHYATSCCLPALQVLSEKGSTLKEKDLLPLG